MKRVYEFFGIIEKPGMAESWDKRFDSIKATSVHTYDRYDPSLGLHKEVKKDLKSD